MIKKFALFALTLCLISTLGACAKTHKKDYSVPIPAPIETQMVK